MDGNDKQSSTVSIFPGFQRKSPRFGSSNLRFQNIRYRISSFEAYGHVLNCFNSEDFDNDGFITESDVICLLNSLTGINDSLNLTLPTDEREDIIDFVINLKVFLEAFFK